MKQTAVESLKKHLIHFPHIKHSQFFKEIIEQAKQMEKEQIIKAYEAGWVNGDLKKAPSNGVEYYNEAHKK